MKRMRLIGRLLLVFYYSAVEANQLRVWKKAISCFAGGCLLISGPAANAGMLTFPLPAPLHNSYALARAGECYADEAHITQTNPVKKLRQDNALTPEGRQQAVQIAKELTARDFVPSYIWVSNTERAYETAVIIGREVMLGQNRIVPEYSFLDARAVGKYEGTSDALTWEEIHARDEEYGINYRPPSNTDGTPAESVADVLVRANQLVSTIESMHSGENVLIVSPDSENLSVLLAAISNENPDSTLPKHFQFAFANGEVRQLQPFVKTYDDRVATGQLIADVKETSRRVRALRVAGSAGYTESVDGPQQPNNWFALWKMSVDALN